MSDSASFPNVAKVVFERRTHTVDLIVVTASNLSCALFCLLTICFGTSGSLVPARQSLMFTTLCAAFSCGTTMLAVLLRLLNNQVPRCQIGCYPCICNSVLLAFWLVFARQASYFVAERTGIAQSAPQLHERRGHALWNHWLPVILAGGASFLAVDYPRATRPTVPGLFSVLVNALADGAIIYQFQHAWKRVIGAAVPPGTQPSSKTFMMYQPVLVGLVVMSINIPMAFTAIYKTEENAHYEQVWLTVSLSIRLMVLVICFLTTSTAADEHMEMQLELRAAGEKLRVQTELNSHRAQFLRYVFHELRNPFNSLHLAIGELLEELSSLPEDLAELVYTMKSSSDSMRVIIDDVLDVSRMQSSAFQLKLRPLSLQYEMQLSVAHMRPFADSMRVAIRLLLPPREQLGTGCFMADRTRFVQVLNNLVSNACKFSPQHGRAEVVVQLEVEQWLEVVPEEETRTVSDREQQKQLHVRHRRQGSLWRSITPQPYSSLGAAPMECLEGGQDTGEEAGGGQDIPTGDVFAHYEPRVGQCLLVCPATGERVPRPAVTTCQLDMPLIPCAAEATTQEQTGGANGEGGSGRARGQSKSGSRTGRSRDEGSETLCFTDRAAVVRITVCDQGSGIPQSDMDKMFKPFSQLDAGLQYKGRGTGLGLAISREIVTKHGGCLGVASVEGQGSDFFMRVALRECERQPELQHEFRLVANADRRGRQILEVALDPSAGAAGGTSTLSSAGAAAPANHGVRDLRDLVGDAEITRSLSHVSSDDGSGHGHAARQVAGPAAGQVAEQSTGSEEPRPDAGPHTRVRTTPAVPAGPSSGSTAVPERVQPTGPPSSQIAAVEHDVTTGGVQGAHHLTGTVLVRDGSGLPVGMAMGTGTAPWQSMAPQPASDRPWQTMGPSLAALPSLSALDLGQVEHRAQAQAQPQSQPQAQPQQQLHQQGQSQQQGQQQRL